MEGNEERKLTLKTVKGCRRLLAISIAIILLFSCFAHLLTTAGGKVKLVRVQLMHVVQ